MNGPFVAGLDRHLAHRAHLAALFGALPAIAPGYRRADARLRRDAAADVHDPRFDTVAALLRAVDEPTADAAWFARRWGAGDAASAQTEATRLADAANRAPRGHLLAGWRVRVVVAGALRPFAWHGLADLDERATVVAAGPQTAPVLVLLAGIAATMPEDDRLSALHPQDRDRIRLHMAGSALARVVVEDPALDPLMEEAARALLPPQHQERRLIGLVTRFAASGLLDQPPGEVERLTRGLARRRPDRLHRAWRRAFFVPRDYPLERWLGAP